MKVPQSAAPTNSPTTSVLKSSRIQTVAAPPFAELYRVDQFLTKQPNAPFVIVEASFVMIGMTRIMIGSDAQQDRAFPASSRPHRRGRRGAGRVRRAPAEAG